jgi:DNA invertase Pin-like site-specific DNA recombinase
MRVALYLRVSTSEQNTANQARELKKVCVQRGWFIARIFEDHGISGAKGRDKRPALDQMLKAATRGEFDIVAAWAVDRLGRSLADLISILNDLNAAKVGLYLHQQALDTTTPSGRAMFQMVGVFAEFERSMIQERIKAGLSRAKAEGKILGNTSMFNLPTKRDICFALEMEEGVTRVARRYGCSRQTIYNVMKELGYERR